MLGVLLGDLILTTLACLGLNFILSIFDPQAKWIHLSASVILFWFEWSLWKVSSTHLEFEQAAKAKRSCYFMAVFVVTLADTEALAFYFGGLPIFAIGESIQFQFVLGLFVVILLLICGIKGAYAWLALKGEQWAASAVTHRRLLRIAAALVTLIALPGVFQILFMEAQ
ncbi:hypothetical protein QEH59_04295 [Coraliomargarita sp. SDUM461004]|uniref:Uncharacterized protein n=1 Tax=Thalassobacterium sedimentorum TaxID=3041258 RepID=A0ABU1AFM6_9BACT|nr:hypothetical protein [Coraliomargarita sp. SDUM461004]MDQ8193629.1 hypothetical protein [Coraliomargarita sp. SDUM461004]